MDATTRTPQQLGQALRSRRKTLNLSQTQVGSKVGMKQDTVSQLEIRTASSTVGTLFKALSALGLEMVVREKARAADSSQEW